MLNKIIKSLFSFIGLEIRKKVKSKKYSYYRDETMLNALMIFKDKLTSTNTIIDVGAASGAWSQLCSEIWPHSSFILFEPLLERKDELEALTKKYSNYHFIPCAAGNASGSISFNVADDLDGSGIVETTTLTESLRIVPITSIDLEIKRLNLKGNYIVKLDTHGFEVPILEGCEQILSKVQLFIIECYGFQITKNSLLFWEMCQYMDNKGFKLANIVAVSNRPKDDSFWQCDAFFVPKSFYDIADNSYN